MYHKKAKLKFHCTACGACCTGKEADYVLLRNNEINRIRDYLGLTNDWFRRRYLEKLGTNHMGIRMDPDGRCPFLTVDNKCRIYKVRPAQCISYPFWPEILDNKSIWMSETSRCEGINNGDIVPMERIMRMLSLSEEPSDL